LAIVRVLLAFVDLPLGLLPVANTLVGILFLGAPIIALFFAARTGWTPRVAALFVVAGLVLQFGFFALARFVLGDTFAGQVAIAISQIGLPMWCVGLGALLATLVKDKNILIPIAIFLAIYDVFLVLTPVGPTRQMVTSQPIVFESIAAAIPSVGKVRPSAYAGPADFVFLSMFFIAMFRFRMRTEQTLRWIVPVLFLYLVLVGFLKTPLPALVPIGATVLLVNRREFKMNRDEKIATILVAILGIGLLIWGATRPAPPAEPSPSDAAQGAPRPAGSP
jgi:hypothetical protein